MILEVFCREWGNARYLLSCQACQKYRGNITEYCERRYFCAAKFSRIKPYVTILRGNIFAHFVSNSILPIVI